MWINLTIALGVALLSIAALSRLFVGKPFLLLGVRALSVIALANSALLLAILMKLFEKR